MSSGYIRYNECSISSAFNDFYVVPDYQREYVWKDEQVEQLVSDLTEAFEDDPNKSYFLGTIVTFAGGGNTFELIDGQQRLTTFFILLCAIKHIYKQNNDNTGVFDNLIFSSTINADGETVNQYHLRLQYEDAGNCLELIEKNEPMPQNVTQSGGLLFGAYKLLTNFLTEYDKLKKFVGFLLNKTSFIRIETQDMTNALKIFETINQRGKGLDPMDLLKNMVFRQVNRDKFKELNMNWREITKTLEKIDEKPLRFLRYFIMANYDTSDCKDGILREDDIYNWLTKNNHQCQYEEAPFKFVQKMKENVEAYAEYRKPGNIDNGNIHLKNIPLLAGSSYKLHLMLMLAAANMNDEAKSKFKGVIESVVYYTVINKIATNVTERTFVSWCSAIRDIKTIDDLNAFVTDSVMPIVTSWKTDNEINFLRLGLNSMQQYRIKFILGKITAYVDTLRLGEKVVGDLSAYTQSAVEIEHIMPQTCNDISAYGFAVEDDYKAYLNRLGNLTLLENGINSSIHNDRFKEKSQEYKKSKFYLTIAISELIYQGQNTAITRTNKMLRAWSEWTKDSIDERQKMLYELSERIWSLSPSCT